MMAFNRCDGAESKDLRFPKTPSHLEPKIASDAESPGQVSKSIWDEVKHLISIDMAGRK